MHTSILVVDDDPGFRKTLFDILYVKGYKPTTVDTGKKAIDYVQTESPGVALIDLRLEDMSGLQLMKQIKKVSPHTECIVLTGYASQQSAIEAINLGAYSYIQKPYDIDQLLITIRRAIEKQKTEKQVRHQRDRSQQYLDIAGVILMVFNIKGEISLVNRKGCEILEYDEGELIGQNWVDTCIPSRHKEKVRRIFQQLMTGKKRGTTFFESQVLTKLGQEKTVTWYNTVLTDENENITGVLSSGQDITDQKRAEIVLAQYATQLTIINDIGRQIAAELDLDRVFDSATHLVQKNFGYHHVALFTVDHERKELIMRSRAGSYATLFPDDHRIKKGTGVNGWVAQHGKKLLANDVNIDSRYINFYPKRIPTLSELSVPIKLGDEVLGVFDTQSPKLNAFTENDVMVMETLSDQIAVAIQNARLFQMAQQELVVRKRAEDALSKRIVALTQPLDDIEDILFTDLFNLDNIQKIQDAFAETTGVASIITTPKGTPITQLSNFCRLCRDIIKEPEKGLANCLYFDTVAGRFNPQNSIAQPCLNGGRWEGGASITVGNKHVANWLVGQIKYPEKDNEEIVNYARQTGVNEDECRAALKEIPPMPVEQFERINQTLFLLANQMSQTAFQNVQQARFITERKQAEKEIRRRNQDLALINRVIAASAAEPELNTLLEIVCREMALAFEVPLATAALINKDRTEAVVVAEYLSKGQPSGLNRKFPIENNPSFEYLLTKKIPLAITNAQNDLTQESVHAIMAQRETASLMLIPLIIEGQVEGSLRLDTLETRQFTTPEINLAQSVASQVAGALARAKLIKEREQLQEQYHQSQKMESMGRLTGGIAHDFNNLLTAINGFAELLQMRFSSSDPQYKMLTNILQSGQRAADLVRQLLAFSRKQIIEPQVLDLNESVTQLNSMLRRVLGEDIQLKTDLVSTLAIVKIDPTQLEQVIINLSVNARDAMPNGGQLVIKTGYSVLDKTYAARHPDVEPGDYVLLSISDTGEGMNKETASHIFEPFFTTKEQGKGTGLGLATVYGIIKQNKGHVQVLSEINSGTTFNIYLPNAQKNNSSQPRKISSQTMPTGNETILLVEDDISVREFAWEVLLSLGYTVLEAKTGEEALQIAAEYNNTIHLLLTDVIMPGINGKILSEKLVSLQPDLNVLYMSGYTDNAIGQHGVLESGIMLIQKPLSPTVLARKVRDILDGVN